MKRFFYIALLMVSFVRTAAADSVHIGKPYFRNISALEYDGHNRNFDIICDRTGRVFVANFEGLLVWNGVNWKMIHTPAVSRVTDLYESENGRIWFGGYNVFGYLDGDEEVSFIVNDADSLYRFGEVRKISSRDGAVSFETDDGCFAYENGQLNPVQFTTQDPPVTDSGVNDTENITDQELTAIATKSEGVIFTDTDGLEKYRLNSDDGLCSDNISALAYDGKGSLWGTTDNGIFSISVSPVFAHFTRTDGLLGQVTSICIYSGTLMVGTLDGLYVKNSGETHFRKCAGLNLACWQVVPSPDGNIYAATAQGLYLYAGGRLRQLTTGHTISVLPSDDGTVLLGELDGMYLLRRDLSVEKRNDIPGVLKFTEDAAGGVRAVNNYQESYYAESFHSRFEEVKDRHWSLLLEYVDDEGRLWHSGEFNNGVLCEALTPQESSWLRMLDRSSIDAMCVDGRTVYLGGSFGLITADMDGMAAHTPYHPTIRFRTMDLDNTSISCSFSADKTDPMGEMQYSYRLHDEGEWSPWSEGNTVSFEHMQSGKYSLVVRCMDSFGIMGATEPVSFRILPPIYLRWYAILLYFIIASILASVIYRIRVHSMKVNEDRLKQKVEERTAQLKEAQGQILRQEREATVGKLTKGLIDRILNPMNYINNFSHLSLGLAKDLKEDVEDEKEGMSEDNYDDCMDVIDMLNTNLTKIEQHGLATTRILKAMEEMMKERSGKIELTDMVQICAQDHEMFIQYNKETIEKYGMTVRWNAPSGPVRVMADQTAISKTIMSVLTNSIYALVKKCRKSPDTEPVVELSLRSGEDGHGCVITVHDNGTGIADTIMDRIFDPFFTDKPTAEASGVGLYLCRQSVQDMGGTIGVKSEKDKYTDVIITLPK